MAVISRDQYARYNRYFTHLKDLYNKKPEVKESVELLLSLLMISFLVIFALRPTVTTIAELFANVKSQQEIAQKLDEKTAALQKARISWGQQQNDLLLLDVALPQKAEPGVYLRQVEGLTAQHNLKFLSFTQQDVHLFGKDPLLVKPKATDDKSPKIKGVKPMNVTFTVSGDYPSLMAFLSDIEQLRQVLLIESFSLALSATSAQEISLKISGFVPYFEGVVINEK